MNLDKLRKEQELIESYINRFYDITNKEAEPILDGIVNEEKYIQSKCRIAWVLKEPYDEDNGKGGGWSIAKDLLAQNDLYRNVVGNSPTWQPMIYTTYSLLNDFLPYKDMEYIRDLPEMAQCLNEIAYININKMPAGHRSNDNEIADKYTFWKPLLHWQLKVYKPQIVIFGNTFQHFFPDMDIDDNDIKHGDCVDYFIQNHCLFLSAYHPGQTVIDRASYVQELIDISKNNFMAVL